MPWRELDAAQITKEMGVGWNLGNTMDGHTGFNPSETLWQPTVTTQALITAVHNAGFNTLRLPVTWGTMIDDDNGYKINEAWLSRVQDIADYAMRQDMYVIVNIHHDGAEQTGCCVSPIPARSWKRSRRNSPLCGSRLPSPSVITMNI